MIREWIEKLIVWWLAKDAQSLERAMQKWLSDDHLRARRVIRMANIPHVRVALKTKLRKESDSANSNL